MDDKIIKAAKEMQITAPEVAQRFIDAFKADTHALNIKEHESTRYDHIEDIIDLCKYW